MNFQNMIQVISNMVSPLLTCEDNHPTMTGLLPNKKRTLAHDPLSLESPGSTKHVVIVMDALKEFTTEILEWVLENIFEAGGTVTLLGVTPWPNIPSEYYTICPLLVLDGMRHFGLIFYCLRLGLGIRAYSKVSDILPKGWINGYKCHR